MSENQQNPQQGGKPMDMSIREQLSRGLEERTLRHEGGKEWGGDDRTMHTVPMWKRPIAVTFGIVSQNEIVSFFEQLALLLECGMPLLRALNSIHNRWRNPVFQRVIGKMAATVEQGRTFSEAVGEHPRYFPNAMIAMIRAGEKSGRLGQMLERIAHQGENMLAVRRKAINLMIYPALVLTAAVIVVAVVFGILTKEFAIFQEATGQEVPWSMQLLFNVGVALRSPMFWGGLVAVIVGLVILYMFARQAMTFRLLRDRLLLRCPGVGHFVKQGLLVDFARVFSTLLNSGVPLEESLTATRGTSDNEVLRLTVDRVKEAVRRGERLTPTLARGNTFPDLAYDLCAVGEESGMLDRVFSRIADVYDEKQSTELAMIGNLVQPAIIVVLAIVVGFILFSFFSMYAAGLQGIGAQI
jgi:type IV pilus assembly protein PilC